MGASNIKNYLCLVEAPSPATSESCLNSLTDCVISLSGFGDGEATGVDGGVAGELLPIEILVGFGDSKSILVILSKT